MKYNYRDNMLDHLNVMRTFAMADESALLMAVYLGEKPQYPFPYFTEVMTGFEYSAAIGMLYEGQTENGLKCIQNVRDRYDGNKRNPFNEAEYGNHYARAMIAWGGVLASTEYLYSAVNQSMSFTSKNGKYFWSNGYQYGSVEIGDKGKEKSAVIKVLNGELSLKSFSLKGFGTSKFKNGKTFTEGEAIELIISKN